MDGETPRKGRPRNKVGEEVAEQGIRNWKRTQRWTELNLRRICCRFRALIVEIVMARVNNYQNIVGGCLYERKVYLCERKRRGLVV